jgi:hypothetical protein
MIADKILGNTRHDKHNAIKTQITKREELKTKEIHNKNSNKEGTVYDLMQM